LGELAALPQKRAGLGEGRGQEMEGGIWQFLAHPKMLAWCPYVILHRTNQGTD